MEEEVEPFPSLSSSSSSSSSFLRDISNFKTPKRPSNISTFNSPCPQFFTAYKQSPCPQFFTASRQTPRRSSSSFRHRSQPSLAPSSSRSKAAATARKLKAFELEQSKCARKELQKKEQSLKSLSKSLTVWLNFLFQNPTYCGCDLSINGGNDDGNVVRVDNSWRCPKRMRELWWTGEESENVAADISSSKYSNLKSSLKEVCSFDDSKQRMRIYLSLGSCKEIFSVMTRVVKNIDEGRLKMKAHCPIVTDVGMKEKACKILMSYNPIWLRIGLYIIFGGDSLLTSDEDIDSTQDISLLKMVLEKQFFSHAGLAKAYAYNKKVEGLYRPGYYETLGNVILKRILLLVLILDRGKSQTTLPLKYGIDGKDGGSPLLFTVSSGIKSSRQILSDFLSTDVMHGEGNLLSHLVIVGYKVSHQQCTLVEFDFQVSDLFVDLQDGVRLCRVIQLLRQDPSILTKIVVPSDTRKKNLANCGVAQQYLRQAGVMLCDEDGVKITGDDVADGDKELTLSLLWNVFVHLQLPLLLNKTIIADEISKILGSNTDNLINSTLLGTLLNWIQAICQKYDLKIDSFSSLGNGKVIWCLLDYYFRRELSCSCSSKLDSNVIKGEESIMSATDYTDAVHNFMLSQKLTSLLGNFPEVLQISDLLEHKGVVSDQSVVVLLVFLFSQLTVRNNVDQLNFHKLLGCDCQILERRYSLTRRQSASSEAVVNNKERDRDITEDAAKKFKVIQAWWRDMTEQNYKNVVKPAASSSYCLTEKKTCFDITRENAAIIIQSYYRRLVDRRKFLKMTKAICLMQTVLCAWLTVKKNLGLRKFSFVRLHDFPSGEQKRQIKFIVERHNFVNLRRSVLLIQQAARNWIARRRWTSSHDLVKAAIVIQKYFHGRKVRSNDILVHAQIENASLKRREKGVRGSEIEAATRIQIAWKNFVGRTLQKQIYAATKIQSHYHSWQLRRKFMKQKQAVTLIQSNFRRLKCWRAFQIARMEFVCRSLQNQSFAAIKIQSHFRSWQLRRRFMEQKQATMKVQSKAATRIQIAWKNFVCRSLQKQHYAATKIQSHYCGWLLRRRYMKQKQAIKLIQSSFKRLKCWRAFQIARREFLCRSIQNQSFAATKIQSHFRCWQLRRNDMKRKQAIMNIQSKAASRIQIVWKNFVRRSLQKQTYAATKIQSHYHGWQSRRIFMKQKQAVTLIQSNFRRLKCWRAFQRARREFVCIYLQNQSFASTKIQSHFCSWQLRRRFMKQKQAIIKIQSNFRRLNCLRAFQQYRTAARSAIIIQSYVRGWIAQKKAWRNRHLVVVIQRHCRGWLVRKELSLQKNAVIMIQRAIRCSKCQKEFNYQKQAAIQIQRLIRGQIIQNRFLGAASIHAATASNCNFKITEGFFWSSELTLVIASVLKLQRWWRGVLLKLRTKAAIIIQSHARGWIARQKACRERQSIVTIQSYWKGYVARKKSRGQLMDLRLRMQKSAKNVDDSRRIINRLLSALSELLSMKSISGILHNCETLDMATAHSQKCCEELVAAGAIGILLKLIRSASRSIPDQEVLRHSLSTLRNLVRYPKLAEVLIDTPGSIEIIFWELLRNKEEGYFIASQILKKLCANHKGLKAEQKFPSLLKRLHSLVEELTRKATIGKRKPRAAAVRENTDRRLLEAVELLQLITES